MNEAKIIKKEKRINKKLNRITKRLKRVKISNKRKGRRRRIARNVARIDNTTGATPVEIRSMGQDKALQHVRMFRKFQRNQYVTGLLFPDKAVHEGIVMKLPSELPLPTSCVGFHENYQLSTSNVGTFLLTWRPNFFTTLPTLQTSGYSTYSKITYNNSSGLVGNTTTSGNNFIDGAYVPAVNIQRYRLVSALIKISYNGTVLNQSGTMLSCISFDNFRVACNTSNVTLTATSDPNVDRFGNFNLIANGLWNASTNITSHGEGLECLYVPVDPNDVMFDKTGTYYGTAQSTAMSPGNEGAPQGYLVCGRNLPASASCIVVDTYYNFEVIPDPDVAPIMRASTHDMPSKSDGRVIGDHISKYVSENSLIRKITSRDDSVWSNILNYGIKFLPKLLSIL